MSRAASSEVSTPIAPEPLRMAEPAPSADVVPDRILPKVPFSRKIALTAACLAALLAVPYAHPKLARLRLLEARQNAGAAAAPPFEPAPEVVGEAALPGETRDPGGRGDELEAAPIDARSPIAHAEPTTVSPGKAVPLRAGMGIEDPSGHALDAFLAKLVRADHKEPGAVARILYYGDSIVASDFVTGRLRRNLQTRFGDAGHGYALIANAWPGWFHIDVARSASATWKVSKLVGPYAADGLYGLGGVSFHAEAPDAWARFATVDQGDWGRRVSRFEIEYLAQPGGGDLALTVDGKDAGVLHTAGDAPKLATHVVGVPDGPHALELRTVDTRPVRAFGVRMERDVPGVVLSALGITGARARFLDKSDDAHWAEALAAAKPDLVALAFGSNETTDGMMYPLADYESTLRALMRQVRAALPQASLMLVGPPDMATAAEGTMHTRPTLPVLVKIQRKLAAEEGWAFWDQFTVMGGAGSMWAWMKTGLGNADMFHPTGIGANQLGSWEYEAILGAYDRYAHR